MACRRLPMVGMQYAEEYVDVAFGTFAHPGTKWTAVLDLREAGEYLAICFIPQGATPENDEAR